MGKISRYQLFTTAVLAGFTAVSAWAGYFVMFSRFAPYDDEGYLMITVKHFMGGFPLYDDVYTQYGPSYYLLRAIVYPLIGSSHDRGRLFSLAVWILIALLVAIYTYRVTSSVTLAVFAHLATFRLLSVIANEPGHPQELCGLILALALLLPLNSRGWALLGVLAGVLLLTKVNVGGLFVISLGILFRGRVRQASLAAAALLPVVLMRHHLTTAWGLEYCCVATASIIAVSVVLLRRDDLPQIPLRDACIGFGALLITVLSICGVILMLGTSTKGLLYGVVLQNLTFADRFDLPLTFMAVAIPGALLAFVLALVLWPSSKVIALLKIGSCIAILFIAIKGPGMSLMGFGRGDLMILFAAPYLWLGMTSGGLRRVFVCSVASLQILQAYPIAGSQTAFGSFLMVPVALCGVGESLKELLPDEAWAWPKYRKAALLISLASLSLAWGFVNKKTYNSYASLNLPGAKRIRLPASQAATYTALTQMLTDSCDGFVSTPGLNSFYFWTEKEPPTHLNATGWALLLNDKQQREVIRHFADYSRPCVLLWGDRPLENARRFPLVDYIASDFHEVDRMGKYTFMLRNDRAKTVASTTESLSASPAP